MRSPDSTHAPMTMDPQRQSSSAHAVARGRLPESGPPPAAESARFRRIFEENFAFVWRTLRRLGVAEGSLADASQRVFWAAARKLDEVADGRVRGFLFGTARRVAADFRRLGRRVVPTDHGDTVVDLAAPTTEELVDQKRARELLDELFNAMADDLREVLVLQEGEGMSLSEIAEMLDIPLGTAASRLRRARDEFRRLLKRRMARPLAGGIR